jgi:hypothetical protein
LSGSLLSHPAKSFIDFGDVSLGRLSTDDSRSCVCVCVRARARARALFYSYREAERVSPGESCVCCVFQTVACRGETAASDWLRKRMNMNRGVHASH